jgi:hypothetical protein
MRETRWETYAAANLGAVSRIYAEQPHARPRGSTPFEEEEEEEEGGARGTAGTAKKANCGGERKAGI